jgi:SAM-dependent methyltransferase
VAGLDASEALLLIAHELVPQGDFRIGDMEQLPYTYHDFDVVTGFNSFQYASRPVTALHQAKRAVKAEGHVVMLIWGRAQDCQHAATLAAVGGCLPPPPPGACGPFALPEPDLGESLTEQAGLTPTEQGEVVCPFVYPDEEVAWKAISSAGPVVRAVGHAGEATVRQAVFASLVPYWTRSGGYRQENLFRYVIATA